MKRYLVFLMGMMLILSACEQQTLQDTISITEQELTHQEDAHLHDDTCPSECYIVPEYTKEVTIKLPFTDKAVPVTVGIYKGYALYQGDIILGTEDEVVNRGVATDGRRWPNSTIPYTIAAGFNSTQLNRIMDAVEHINENTVLCVVPRTNEADYVEFIPTGGCASYIGRRGGKQTIWLSSCSFGSTVHEVLHASGIYHEQSREDRDNYITVNYQNISSFAVNNFNIAPTSTSTDYGPYDYGSIMHYGNFGFSSNGLPTITTIPPGIPIGQRNGLSAGDIATLDAMYEGCESSCGGGGGTTASGCGVTVSISGLNVTLTANNNSNSGIIKVRTPSWSWSQTMCNDWTGNSCTSGKTVTVPGPGTYVVDTQFGGVCTFTITVDGSGGGSVDMDGDGVCSDVDCDDNDPNVGAQQTPGTSCNDGNPNTINDVIQADGCTCQGQPIGGCSNPTTINENCSGASVEVCDGEITIDVSNNSIRHITINDVDAGWAVVELVCASWSNSCNPGSYTYTVPQSGNYSVQFNYYSSPTCGTGAFFVQ